MAEWSSTKYYIDADNKSLLYNIYKSLSNLAVVPSYVPFKDAILQLDKQLPFPRIYDYFGIDRDLTTTQAFLDKIAFVNDRLQFDVWNCFTDFNVPQFLAEHFNTPLHVSLVSKYGAHGVEYPKVEREFDCFAGSRPELKGTRENFSDFNTLLNNLYEVGSKNYRSRESSIEFVRNVQDFAFPDRALETSNWTKAKNAVLVPEDDFKEATTQASLFSNSHFPGIKKSNLRKAAFVEYTLKILLNRGYRPEIISKSAEAVSFELSKEKAQKCRDILLNSGRKAGALQTWLDKGQGLELNAREQNKKVYQNKI